MNKEKLKHKLEQTRIDRDLAHIQANKEIDRLKAQLTEAEKLKLRHGDFGIDTVDNCGSFVVIEQKGLFGTPKAFFENQSGRIKADEGMSSDLKLGNIFDLMKDWGEDFEKWESKPAYKGSIQIIIEVVESGIFFGNSGRAATFDLETITKIWRNLGHAIMELKRKEQENAKCK